MVLRVLPSYGLSKKVSEKTQKVVTFFLIIRIICKKEKHIERFHVHLEWLFNLKSLYLPHVFPTK